jgi:hypothetical protein
MPRPRNHNRRPQLRPESTSPEDRCVSCGCAYSLRHKRLWDNVDTATAFAFLLKRGREDWSKDTRPVHFQQFLSIANRLCVIRALALHLGEDGRSGHYITWVRCLSGYMIYDDSRAFWHPGHELPDLVRTTCVLVVYEPLAHLAAATVTFALPYLTTRDQLRLSATSAFARGAVVSLGRQPSPTDHEHPHAPPLRHSSAAEAQEDDPDLDDAWPGEAALEDGIYLPPSADGVVEFYTHARQLRIRYYYVGVSPRSAHTLKLVMSAPESTTPVDLARLGDLSDDDYRHTRLSFAERSQQRPTTK